MTSPTASRPSLVPTRADLADAGYLVLLFSVALVGFSTSYTGWSFLWTGLAGLGLGLLVGHVANVLRQPLITVIALTVAVFFLLGGAVVMRERAVAGFLPGPDALGGLARSSVDSWKQLLTTLPPVDSGALLIIPYILGLLCGAGGFTLARRVRVSAAPVVAPALVMIAVILLGTTTPVLPTVLGGLFAAITLGWISVRARRRRRQLRDGARRATRVMSAAALVGAIAAITVLAGPVLPGAGGDRTVLREYITPPFDLNAYASPLVGFRKYTKDANQLHDQTLFTVTGLPEGGLVRIATLDDYTGTVWGAGGGSAETVPGQPKYGFQRVGSRIPSAASGAKSTVEVEIGAAYATADDVNAWLPTPGEPTAIRFAGDTAAGHADSFRYNLATTSGIVADRLRTGDKYTVDTIVDTVEVPTDPQPFGRPALEQSAYQFVSAKTGTWAGGATDLGGKLKAVAGYLRANGAYSDGGPGETEYLPGHSVGRLTSFLNAQRPVGDDEQYAAVFALVANQLGMPARVVLGAKPGAGGVVRGEHVQVWVELHLTDGRWARVMNTEFMPDRSKKPDKVPPQQFENTEASIVPPPNTVHPPSSLTDASRVDPNVGRSASAKDGDGWEIPGYLLTILTWAGPPIALVALVCTVIIGGKALRRRRRRRLGEPATRVASGWQEVMDRARDLGTAVPVGLTRPEQATVLGDASVLRLARAADATVFGPIDPNDAAATRFWASVDEARKQLGAGVGRLRRLKAALNLSTLRVRGS
ncbi:transglutaminase-like domain-containing protein [Actinokineospora cianjurensis]|uniref:Transglutaminase superfamily protein n=1 Tax=Actinokineospora cianjurensis TaxID=585224 RepID=A0A421B5M5_9PSEU|nr:transglutaminase-like domain-containing protein [Actinokineospora cianjurensis]RLK59776.1 transglutaminase superfamily protein [Actinokineospora cianjurensis]